MREGMWLRMHERGYSHVFYLVQHEILMTAAGVVWMADERLLLALCRK